MSFIDFLGLETNEKEVMKGDTLLISYTYLHNNNGKLYKPGRDLKLEIEFFDKDGNIIKKIHTAKKR